MKKKKSLPKTVNVYIGCYQDEFADLAKLCNYSLQKYSSLALNVSYLNKDILVKQKLLNPDADETRMRYLVPYLNNYKGIAVYLDSSVLVIDDIADLLSDVEQTIALCRVEHSVEQAQKRKKEKDIKLLSKGYSGVIVYNCEQGSLTSLSIDSVNNMPLDQLHTFTWIKPNRIKLLPVNWDWHIDLYKLDEAGVPNIVNYKFFNSKSADDYFFDLREEYYAEFCKYSEPKQTITEQDLTLPENLRQLFRQYLLGKRDPKNYWHSVNLEKIIELLELYTKKDPTCIAIIDADPDLETEDKIKVDPIIDNFILGANGIVAMNKDTKDIPITTPAVIRGIAKRKVIKKCINEKRDYYYIDTGYFGNGKHKLYHRITKNNMQYIGALDSSCPDDRFLKTKVTIKPYTAGTNILICPPSQKAMNFWNLNLQDWLDDTIETIKSYTNRPIVIREKQSRNVRVNTDTMEMALADDVHCMVTFNSIAAVESLINGKPVFTMGPNAAHHLSNIDLKTIDDPYMPHRDEIRVLLCNLAYKQFTVNEMRSGVAWEMLNAV